MEMKAGRFTFFVDPEDFEAVSKYTWTITRRDHRQYVCRRWKEDGKNRAQYLHCFLLGGPFPGQDIDHINGDGMDNRRSNLRIVTRSENMANATKMRKDKKSCEYRGVFPDKRYKNGKWYAQIKKSGVYHTMPVRNTPEEAARDYDKMAEALYGPYCYRNFK